MTTPTTSLTRPTVAEAKPHSSGSSSRPSQLHNRSLSRESRAESNGASPQSQGAASTPLSSRSVATLRELSTRGFSDGASSSPSSSRATPNSPSSRSDSHASERQTSAPSGGRPSNAAPLGPGRNSSLGGSKPTDSARQPNANSLDGAKPTDSASGRGRDAKSDSTHSVKTSLDQPGGDVRRAAITQQPTGSEPHRAFEARLSGTPLNSADTEAVKNKIACQANLPELPTIRVDLRATSNLKSVVATDPKKSSFYEKAMECTMDKMMPALNAAVNLAKEAAKLEGKSLQNSQALVVAQVAIERNSPDTHTSSKFALPHVVALIKFDEPDTVLLFAIARHQVSMSANVLPQISLGAGGFLADETGMVGKFQYDKPVTDNPNYNSNAANADNRRTNTQDLESGGANSSDNNSEFIQGDKKNLRLKNTSILTQFHAQLGAGKVWDSSTRGASIATSFGQEQFVGQNYDMTDASCQRKTAIFSRILLENVVAAGCGVGVLLKTGVASAMGVGGVIDPIDAAHLGAMGAKFCARRALDAVVPPSARGMSSSGTLDPADFNRTNNGGTEFQLGSESLKVTTNVYTKLQWKFGGTPIKSTTWKPELEKQINNLNKELSISKQAADNFRASAATNETDFNSLMGQISNAEDSLNDLYIEISKREVIQQEDETAFTKLETEFKAIEEGMNALAKGIEGYKKSLAELPESTTKPQEMEELENLIKADEQRIGIEQVKNDKLGSFIKNELASLKSNREDLKSVVNSAVDCAGKLNKLQSDSIKAFNLLLENTANAQNVDKLSEKTEAEIKPKKTENEALNKTKRRNAFASDIKQAARESQEKKAGLQRDSILNANRENLINKVKVD